MQVFMLYIPNHYIDKAGKWRWTLIGDDNKVYGASHQGFSSRAESVKNFNLQGKKGVMPREIVESICSPYHTKVGWSSDRDVQVGIEVEGEGSIFWALFDNEARQELGREIKMIDVAGMSDLEVASAVLNILDTAGGVLGDGESGYRGLWATLDRRGCNQLIRFLRRARDTAFGADA